MDNETNFDEVFNELFKYFTLNKNITKTCNISRLEAKKGITKNLEIYYYTICEHCKGKEECDLCNNRGVIVKKEKIKVNIPKKTKNNDIIVIKQMGNELEGNNERGDLYIKIHIWGEK